MKVKKAASIPKDNSIDDEVLPEGWTLPILGELVLITSGKSIKSSDYSKNPDKRYPVAGAGGPIGWADNFNFSPPVITLGRVGSAGTLNVYFTNIWVTDNTLVIKPNETILLPFLANYLRTIDWTALSTGSTQPLITQTIVKNILIPLPPVFEQQRIVSRVEALFTHVNAASDRLSRVPLIMKKFRQALLAAACSGKLTDGWRVDKYPPFNFNQINEEHKQIAKRKFKEPNQLEIENLPDLPDNWLWINFSLLINKIKRGPSLKCNQEGNGVRYITSGNLDNGKLRLDLDQKFLNGFDGIEKCQLIPGDLILNCVNSLDRIGKSAIFDESHGMAIVGFNNYGLELNQNFILPKYANFFCQSEFFKRQLFFLVKHAVNQVSFATDELDPIAVSLPPLAEQQEIIRQVETLIAHADQIELQVKNATKRAEVLTKAILMKAFQGDLVATGMAEGQA